MIRWSVRHPVVALIVWVILLVVVGLGSSVAGGKYADVFSLPGVQSTVAQDLLERLNKGKPETNSVTVVWKATDGSATSDSVRTAVVPVLKQLASLPGAECVTTPFKDNFGTKCSSRTNTALTTTITREIDEAFRKATKLTQGELDQVTSLIPKLTPLESTDPAKLATIARALPGLAKVAQAPKPLLDSLASLTPQDLAGLEGLTKADIEQITDAFGGLEKFASLPPAVLKALAQADPAKLASVGRALEADFRSAGFTTSNQLARIAKALPSAAKAARANQATIAALAKLTPADLAGLEGLTKADIDDVIAAFGGLAKFAELPESTLTSLADANAADLAVAARKLPGAITSLEADWAKVQKEIARLHAAGKATEASTSQVSKDGSIAYATVTFTGSTIPVTEAKGILKAIEGLESSTLIVGAQSSALEGADAGPDNSVAIGLLAAIIILAIAFGSLVAAGLPIVVAGTGLAGGLMAVGIGARFMDIATFAPTLASMIGLGVGIDYALFILNRYRQGLQEGKEPKDAALTAVGTAGKAVLFAGSTVIIALLGMFVLRINFFNGLAVAAATAVLFVMLSALIFLPALLSLLGTKALGLRLPWARRLKPFDPDASRWSSYARLLQRKPLVPALGALVIIGLLAFPALQLRTGFPDDGTQAQGTPLRTGFDLMAEGFGPGNGGPFFVAVEMPKKDDFAGLAKAITALEQTPGVARTLPSSGMLPLVELDKSTFGLDGKVTSILVVPTTSPQAEATDALLTTIREKTATTLKTEHDVTIYVGGSQAVSTDFSTVLGNALPVFLLLVIGLGFLALMLLFHSLLIPLTAAITSLLSFAAALGLTVSIFQLGFLDSVLGVTGTGPILPFLPIMVFAILFGLSMDYQVFLVSRMQEEWHATKDNREAVRLGLAGSGRVVVIAASIMTSVFLAFVPTPVDAIKLFGVALASAVIIDAFLVRLVLVPSLMTLFGKANWWLPKWLDRVLPKVTLE